MYEVFLIVSGVLLLVSPVVFLIALIKSIRKKKVKKWWISLIVILVLLVVSAGIGASLMPENERKTRDDITQETTSEVKEKTANESNESKEEASTDVSEDDIFSDVIADNFLRNNFIDACKQTSIDIKRIQELKKVDDWVSGERYSFIYSGLPFRLYTNMDGTVNVLKLGSDIDIYKQGFEPYNVNDFIPDESIASGLFDSSKEYVKKQLNYPDTAKFPIMDWSASRERNLYTISSSVKAKNAFGVSEELSYSIKFLITEENKKIVYFVLGGDLIINEVADLDVPERKELNNSEKSDNNVESVEINLIDGQLGEYGKTVTLDGNDYINYYLPKGNYIIKNKGKMCTIFIAKDEYYKNSDGYMQNDVVNTIQFTEFEETANVTINEGVHIELTINARVSLKKLD